jgi:UDP-N-acetylglucosamine 3-dehydrogenase
MNCALIGMGSMGQNHYKTIMSNKNINLVGVVEPNSDLVKDINIKHYNDVETLLKNENIDFAIIATPTSTHLEIAKKFLERGVDLLVEKPIAKNSLEAKNMVRVAHKNNCKLIVGHIERYNPAIQAVLPRLKNEKIVHYEASRFSGYPTRITDVGVKLDLSIHDIDLMSLLSPSNINHCYCLENANIDKNDDDAVFIIKFYNDALATIRTSWLFPYRERKIKLLAKDKYYVIDLLNKQATVYIEDDLGSFVVESIKVDRADALASQLSAFVEYLKTGNKGSLCDGETAGLALSYVEGENNESVY